MSPSASRSRDISALPGDCSGQLMTEWTLLTAAVIIPFMLLVPGIIRMLDIYFYRIAGVLALPFP